MPKKRGMKNFIALICGFVIVIALLFAVWVLVRDYLFRPILGDVKSLLIMTDLETDDIIAIWLLSKFYKRTKIMFLVGEGCAYIKKLRMESYIKTLGFENAEVVRGYDSDRLFTYDGRDIMSEEDIERLNWIVESKEDVNEKVYKFIRDESPFIISLKPPRELMDMYANGHPRYRRIFNRCVLAGYMSFNLRCLMNEHKKRLVGFLKSFKKCYFYETHYAVGSNNIITEKDFSFDKFPKIVLGVMKWWNLFQAEDCIETLKDLDGKTDDSSIKRIHRNQKTLDQIEGNNHKQFVNADCGLIIALLQYGTPFLLKSIKYDLKTRNPYPTVGSGNDVWLICPEDPKKYREFQVRMMKRTLGIKM